MSPWAAGALALLAALVPCGIVALRRPAADAVVALELAGTIVVLVIVLLAVAFARSSYFVVPLTLAPLSAVGSLLFARYLGLRR